MLKRAPKWVWFALGLAYLIGFVFVVGWSSAQPPHQPKKAESAQTTEKKSIQDVSAEIVAFYTEVLAWFTGVLAIASLFQGYFLLRADKTARISAEVAKESIKLAREEFTSSHRPLLKIKFVSHTLTGEDKLAICFTVVNAADSDAHVIGSATHVEILGPSATEWPDPNDYGLNSVIANRRFAPGATERYMAVSDIVSPIHAYADGDKAVVLMGYVVYRDAAGTPRTTYFCRVHDRESDSFFPPTDKPDYDSTD